MTFRLPLLLLLSGLLIALSCGATRGQVQAYRALWEKGEYQRALHVLEGLLDEGTSGADLSLERDYAELLFQLGRTDDAIAVMEAVVSTYPVPSHSLRLAFLYRYRGRRQEHEDILKRADNQIRTLLSYRLGPEEWLALGQLLDLRGDDPQTVLAHYERLLERHPDYAPALVAAGDLAYRRYAYDVAARKYGQALAIDGRDQEALAGLAECYHQSVDPRIEQTLGQLLALNPRQLRGLLLRAEQALDLGQTEEALGILADLLAINPRHVDGLSLKGAALFLADRPEEAARVRQQALAVNPFASVAFRVSGRVASRHYRFAEGLAFQKRALEVDPEDHRARLLLAFDLLRMGRDGEARAELERVFAADPYDVQAYNLLNVSDAIAEFNSIRRGIFHLQMPALEVAVLADEMFGLLEEAADFYQRIYRVDLQPPVLLQVFDDHDEFMVRSVGLPGSAGHLGICFGQVVTMDSPRARPLGDVNWQQVLWHEFVHVVTLQKTGNRIPRWLSEGISVYEETRRDTSWGQRLDPDFKAVAETAPTAEQLESYFTQPRSQEHLLFGYFAAGEFVRFYVQTYGEEALVRSLDAIGAGEETLQALSAAAGRELYAIDRGFRNHLEKRLAPLANLPDSTDAASASPLGAALQRGEQAEREGDLEEAEQAYREAHRLYPEYQGDDAPLRRLVRLYREHGPRNEYVNALQRIVSTDPRAHAECRELAPLLAGHGRWREAAAVLRRAAQVTPFQVSLLTEQVDYLIEAGTLDEAVRQLEKLLYLDPARSTQHRLRLASILADDGETVAARREVVALLEEMPHYWDAQRLLLEITEQKLLEITEPELLEVTEPELLEAVEEKGNP